MGFFWNSTTPAAPPGTVNAIPARDNASPLPNVSWHVPASTTSQPGVVQLEPSADITKFLRGDGVWASPVLIGGLGAVGTRASTSLVTATLAAGAQQQGTLTLCKSFALLKVVVSSVARVRLYSTAAAQTTDASRPNTTPPTAGTQHGVITDLYLSSALSWILSPSAQGSNMESSPSSSISYTIDNLGGSSAAITVTFTVLSLES